MYSRPRGLRVVRFSINCLLFVLRFALCKLTCFAPDVFLFEGERGHTADTYYHIERTNYMLDDALAVDMSKLSQCSYNECKYPITSKGKKCIAIRSNLVKKSIILDIDLVLNQRRFFSVFVSFLPLIGALVYIKFFAESSTESGAVLHTPGYQLVVEPDL